MDYDRFRASLDAAEPPAGLPAPLAGLWYDARDDWDTAHRIVQADDGRDAAWVHAYLHRREGDLGNAGFWYARAGRRRPEATLAEEWEAIARALCGADA